MCLKISMKKVIDLKEPKNKLSAKPVVSQDFGNIGTSLVPFHVHSMHCSGCGRTYTTSPCIGDYYCVGPTEWVRKGCPQCHQAT